MLLTCSSSCIKENPPSPVITNKNSNSIVCECVTNIFHALIYSSNEDLTKPLIVNDLFACLKRKATIFFIPVKDLISFAWIYLSVCLFKEKSSHFCRSCIGFGIFRLGLTFYLQLDQKLDLSFGAIPGNYCCHRLAFAEDGADMLA